MREQILLDQDYVGERRDAVLDQLEQLATTVADEVETSTGGARLAIYYGATPSSNDLYGLKGIGPKHTEVLESVGVDSIKELSHRSAASLTQMILDRHGRIIGVSEKQVAAWVEEAKSQQR